MRIRLALGCAFLLALGGCGGNLAGTAAPLAGPGNLAVVDQAATAGVLDKVEVALESVFSYDTAAPATHEDAVSRYLIGQAKDEARKLSDPIRTQATHGRITVTAKVTKSAVAELEAGNAVVLAYVTQNGTRPDSGTPTQGLSALSVRAQNGPAGWQLSEIKTPPAIAAPTGAATARDAAVIGARAGAEALTTLDSAKPEETIARWLEVADGDLHREYTTNRDSNQRTIATSGASATGRALAAAAVDVAEDRATVLVVVETQVTGGAANNNATKQMTLQLEVVQVGPLWKVRKIEQVPAS